MATATATATDYAFDAALTVVLEHEGGYVDDPDDPGGATNWGVSLRTLRALGDLEFDVDGDGDIDADDIKALSRDDAGAFYRKVFWDRHGYGRFGDLMVATKVFDLAVNMGPGGGHKVLQRALRACGQDMADDGVLGPQTLAAVIAVIRSFGAEALLAALRSEAAGYYRSLIAAKPVRAKYERGWLRRAYS